ncbi:caspase-7-like [Cyprinus carpio]|uniref:Caspase-7-like n=1 Tax=Cyprinus carpio TaxID=7962 RepID=A0A9Q9WR00_CYPCA|nr:caspase-7-like [Cyprinus carpio]
MPFFNFPFTADKTVKNRALIVSVGNFYPGEDLSKRHGVKRDNQRLHEILSKLGFSVKIIMDIEADEIYEAESKKTVKDCFVGVISSHGEEGVVFGADGGSRLVEGHGLDEGVEADSSFSEEEDGVSELFSIPIDTAVMYATSPGYGAFMHPAGSELIQTFCNLLEEEGGPDLEITRLLTRINFQVAYNFKSRGKTLGGKKQMPCFVTRFTREVFPFRKMAAEEDLSLTFAATQLIDEPKRSRKSSIS